MKKIDKIAKQYRANILQKFIDDRAKNMTNEDKLRVYPNWIRIMVERGEEKMAKSLQDEINEIKLKKSQKPNIFQKIKEWFKTKIKKGS